MVQKSGRQVALLRGINVGRAKAISMAQLVTVFEDLGAEDVTTVLRSGNVVFRGSLTGTSIEDAVLAGTGVHSQVLLLTASEFRSIAEANPLAEVATDGAKSFVTFLSERQKGIEAVDAASIAPELLAVTDRAIYQWMPNGSQQTTVPKSFWKQVSGHVTARNENTVRRILALLDD